MRIILLTILLCSLYCSVICQEPGKSVQIEQVKAAVKSLGTGSKSRVKITLRDLSELEGYIIFSSDDSFDVKGTEKNNRDRAFTVLYSDVLELEGKSVSISLIPDPKLRSFGTWDAVQNLQPGDELEVEPEGGKTFKGALLKTTDSNLTLIRGNNKLEFSREQLLRVFLVRANTSTAAGRILKDADKGVDIADQAGKNTTIRGPISGQTGRNNRGATPIGKGIGAAAGIGIGAGIRGVKKGRNKRVLIYSK